MKKARFPWPLFLSAAHGSDSAQPQVNRPGLEPQSEAFPLSPSFDPPQENDESTLWGFWLPHLGQAIFMFSAAP